MKTLFVGLDEFDYIDFRHHFLRLHFKSEDYQKNSHFQSFDDGSLGSSEENLLLAMFDFPQK